MKKCKDIEETTKVFEKHLPETERFNQLVENVKTSLTPIPKIAIKALYKYFTDDPGLFFGRDDMYEREQAKAAKDEGFLWLDGQMYRINTGDPAVKKAVGAIEKLSKFLEEDASSKFYELTARDIEFEMSIENIRFWRKYFELEF